MTDRQLLFDQGLSGEMLAEQLSIKRPYVSMYFTGHGRLPREAWQKLYEYFLELRVNNKDKG